MHHVAMNSKNYMNKSLVLSDSALLGHVDTVQEFPDILISHPTNAMNGGS